eukprot:11519775-Prorocentrum_lima.AAC.1
MSTRMTMTRRIVARTVVHCTVHTGGLWDASCFKHECQHWLRASGFRYRITHSAMNEVPFTCAALCTTSTC